jgi:hypothetical protein
VGVPWRPGQRDQSLALEAPYEDVPGHLLEPLWSWLKNFLDDTNVAFALGIRLRLEIEDPRRGILEQEAALGQIRSHVMSDSELMLDAIEWLLAMNGNVQLSAQRLESILSMGNSAYRVRDDRKGLEMRIVPEVRQQVRNIVDSTAGSAGAHLATAWKEAYGRTPDPVKAYSEAIKAVEAAAAPVVSPNNLKATLGTLSAELRSNPAKWAFAITRPGGNSIEDVQRLMSLLWSGQTSRHGGVNPTLAETPEAARAAVHIAATLVQFFVGRAIT